MKLTKYVKRTGYFSRIPSKTIDNILIDCGISEDFGSFRVSQDLIVIQTAGVYYPMVDDSYSFGQIAAAACINEMYALGVVPFAALNISGFPVKKLPKDELTKIVKGGCDKLKEAKVSLIGGHSMEDPETKFGYVLFGAVNKSRVMNGKKARVNDRLILVKPLGAGMIFSALKSGLIQEENIDKVIRSMTFLNKSILDIIDKSKVNACIAVGNSGFIGSAVEMAVCGKLGIEIESSKIPFFESAVKTARSGYSNEVIEANKSNFMKGLKINSNVSGKLLNILFGSEISGALLMAVPEKNADLAIKRLHDGKISSACVVGKFVEKHKEKIIVN